MKRPVRVALLATTVEFGGIERVLLNLVQHMGSNVEFVPVLFTRTDTREHSFLDRLRTLGIKYDTLYVNSVKPTWLANPLVNLVQGVSLIRARRIDLIHSHGYRADVFALAMSRLLGLPLVSTCHGYVPIDGRLRFYNALDRYVLRFFSRVIAVSARMKDELVAHGLDATRVDVITNAVADVPAAERGAHRRDVRSRLGIGDDEFVFGYIGRLSEEKGLEYLLRAAARLSSGAERSRVLIVGDGPRRPEYERSVQADGLSHMTDFVGFQSNTAPWYAAMDAFVLPSLTEGTPMALLEAMSHGLPVIASAVGGVPAVLSHERNGLLVPPGDASSLFQAMRSLSSSPALCAELSDGALRSVKGHDVHSWIGRMEDVYRQALQPKEPLQ